MFTIGAFARLAGVSVRTLHYYEELGLLAPAAVDSATGYRRYRGSQLPRLHRVIALKDLGLSLDDIRPILEDISAEQLRGMLVMKRAELHEKLSEERGRLDRVEQRLRYIELEDDMSIDLVIKQLPALRVAEIRWSGAEGLEFNTVGERFAWEASTKLIEHLESVGVTAEGPFLMYGDERPDGTLTPAIAAGIGTQALHDTDDVKVAEIPATEAVVTIYRGSLGHSFIGPIYGQMVRFAEDNGYQVRGPGRDNFIEQNDDEIVLELQLPVVAAT